VLYYNHQVLYTDVRWQLSSLEHYITFRQISEPHGAMQTTTMTIENVPGGGSSESAVLLASVKVRATKYVECMNGYRRAFDYARQIGDLNAFRARHHVPLFFSSRITATRHSYASLFI
jgi:hypothetical protein